MFNVGPHRPYPKAASPVRGSVWSCSRLKLDVWGAIARERGSRSSWSVAEFKARLSNRSESIAVLLLARDTNMTCPNIYLNAG